MDWLEGSQNLISDMSEFITFGKTSNDMFYAIVSGKPYITTFLIEECLFIDRLFYVVSYVKQHTST